MRYMDLAEKYINEIQLGNMMAATKMPSLRKFSKLHSVSMSTTLNCYQHLESLGWIIAKPQSGYFVSNKLNAHQQPTLVSFESQLSEPRQHTVHQLFGSNQTRSGPLGVSRIQPDPELMKAMEQCFRRANKRMHNRFNEYPTPQGEPLLRDTLVRHFSQYDFHFGAQDLVITNGCMGAIKTAIEICSTAGDAIAICSPCFSGLLDLLAAMSRKIVEIPSISSGIDLDQLELHMKNGTIKAGLFCTTHMNPQGITMSPEQKMRLADMARRYETPIIEDDVYIELPHGNTVPLPAKFYDESGYVLWCGSISKTLSASYRLGWCLPGRYKDQYLKMFAAGSYGVSAPMQLATADYIDSGQYTKHLRKKRFELLAQKRQYIEYLQQQLPQGSRISDPAGGLVLWLQIPNLDSVQLLEQANLHGLDIRNGDIFSSLPLYQDCVRINIGYPLYNPDHTPSEACKDIDTLVSLLDSK